MELKDEVASRGVSSPSWVIYPKNRIHVLRIHAAEHAFVLLRTINSPHTASFRDESFFANRHLFSFEKGGWLANATPRTQLLFVAVSLRNSPFLQTTTCCPSKGLRFFKATPRAPLPFATVSLRESFSASCRFVPPGPWPRAACWFLPRPRCWWPSPGRPQTRRRPKRAPPNGASRQTGPKRDEEEEEEIRGEALPKRRRHLRLDLQAR